MALLLLALLGLTLLLHGSARGQPEIAAPYDFGFQLRHYVIAPEVREDQTLIEIIRLSSGGLVKVDVQSRGTVDAPRIELAISSAEPLCPLQLEEVHKWVRQSGPTQCSME
jgi:hypothetical protein